MPARPKRIPATITEVNSCIGAALNALDRAARANDLTPYHVENIEDALRKVRAWIEDAKDCIRIDETVVVEAEEFCPAGLHELADPKNVLVRPNGYRQCRACKRECELRRYHKKKAAA